MTSLWVLLAIVIVLIVALMTYVVLRDRHRSPSGDDNSTGRKAASEAERYAAERHDHGRDVRENGPASTGGGF